ncbi:MAG: saccharopine dehydrogenase NADP-binding domain-containing protein [Geminicoccaceae bacterium]
MSALSSAFSGRILMVGCGSVGQTVLPLLLRELGLGPDRVRVIAADERGREVAAAHDVRFERLTLTPECIAAELAARLQPGDFLLNLSVEVASLELLRCASGLGALYLDTGIEPWPGGYTDPRLSLAERSNQAFRAQALALRRELGPGSPTAVICQGANPGLVSQLVKAAGLELARAVGLEMAPPSLADGWAGLFRALSIRTIQISEHDSQVGRTPKASGEFVATWSVDGFLGEGSQPAELGWGTAEGPLPADGRRHSGDCPGIYLLRPGMEVRVRSWSPGAGAFVGYLITHMESLSIADHLTLRSQGRITYRPTVHYAYHPCPDALLSVHELIGRGFEPQPRRRILAGDIVTGQDELGVLLAGNPAGAFWYGSQLAIDEARRIVPHANATSLQVAAGILGGMAAAMADPGQGVLEPEELDYALALAAARPYLGRVVGTWCDWTPLTGRGRLFPEQLDRSDPWRFSNVRVA